MQLPDIYPIHNRAYSSFPLSSDFVLCQHVFMIPDSLWPAGTMQPQL